jgi:AcrR family transcriptional regulator
MARRTETKAPAVRKRRTAEEARSAILDAAERALVAGGPAGIRLQEVAADVGVSHPTVLHHFGSREGLIEAVQSPKKGTDQVEALLDRVSDTMVNGGHARTFLWLALSGYQPSMEQLRVRSLAEAVHEVRRGLWQAKGKRVPPFEDTYFTVLLPAVALLAMSVMETKEAKKDEGPCSSRRFRAWLAKLVHEHLEEG